MRIDDVRSYVAGCMHFVTLHTDNGLVGLGQSGFWAYPTAVHAIVERFRDYLVGKDPSQIERHWQHPYRMGPFRGAALTAAVSAVDIALWDIKSQHFHTPVHELLGGRYRDRVRLCRLLWSKDGHALVAEAQDAASQGFTAVKFDPLLAGYQDASYARMSESCMELVGAVRSAVGLDVDIVLELHRKLTPLQALPLIERLASFSLLFCEDPNTFNLRLHGCSLGAWVEQDSRY